MGEVAKEGRTILFVSHNMAAVEALCTSACLLTDGQLAPPRATNEVIDTYLRGIRRIAAKDLIDRRDRSGSGRLLFTSVVLNNSNGTPTDTLASGSAAAITLEYRADSPLKNVSVSIGFYGIHGQFLLLCNNEMAGQPFESPPQNGSFRCLIPRLPFTPGTYTLNLYCEVNGIVADWVQEACQVAVVEGDFYGTGRSSPTSHGGFLTDQNWSHSSEDAG
jgi:lipopolysaccharide transport system ATP-binding protein